MEKSTLLYEGLIDESFIAQVAEMLNGVLTLQLGQRKDLRKICGFGLELLDNGMRYGSDHRIIFKWSIGDKSVVFEMTNKAHLDDAQRLLDNAASVRGLSDDELNSKYKEQMLNPEFGKKGGAGLGLLQLVRRGAKLVDVRVTANDTGDYICHSTIEANLIQKA